jgi:hypothetical protein
MFAIRARDAEVHMNIENHSSLKRKTYFSNGLLEALTLHGQPQPAATAIQTAEQYHFGFADETEDSPEPTGRVACRGSARKEHLPGLSPIGM